MDSPISILAKPRSLVVFFTLAFSFAWIVWVPAALASYGLISFQISPILSGLLGTLAPSLAGLVTTVIYEGWAGLRNLFKRLVTWRVEFRWYLFVLLWPATLSLTTTGISILLGSLAPNFSRPLFVDVFPQALGINPFVFVPILFLQQMFLGSSMGEELGWRGYALPRLQFRQASLIASLLLGLAWGAWHLPLWLTKGNLAQETFAGWHFLELLATTVLFTWVYNNTRGSLLLALVFHASIGVTGMFLAAVEYHPAIPVALSWGLVALVIMKFGLAHLSSKH